MDNLEVDLKSSATTAANQNNNLEDTNATQKGASLNVDATAKYLSVISRHKGLLTESHSRTFTQMQGSLNGYVTNQESIENTPYDKDSAQIGHYRKLTVAVINRDPELQEKVASALSTSRTLVRSKDASSVLENDLKNLPKPLSEGCAAGKNLSKFICQSVVNLTDTENMGAGLQRDLAIRDVYLPDEKLSLRQNQATTEALNASIAYVKSNQPDVLKELPKEQTVSKIVPGSTKPQIMTRYLRQALDEFPEDSTYLDIFKKNKETTSAKEEQMDEVSQDTSKRIKELIMKAAESARRGNLIPSSRKEAEVAVKTVETRNPDINRADDPNVDASKLSLSELSARAAKLQAQFREERQRIVSEGKLPDPAPKITPKEVETQKSASVAETKTQSTTVNTQSSQNNQISALSADEIKELARQAVKEAIAETLKVSIEQSKNSAKEAASEAVNQLKSTLLEQIAKNNDLVKESATQAIEQAINKTSEFKGATEQALNELKATMQSKLDENNSSVKQTQQALQDFQKLIQEQANNKKQDNSEELTDAINQSIKKTLELSAKDSRDATQQALNELKTSMQSKIDENNSSFKATQEALKEFQKSVHDKLNANSSDTIDKEALNDLKKTFISELEDTKEQVKEAFKQSVKAQMLSSSNTYDSEYQVKDYSKSTQTPVYKNLPKDSDSASIANIENKSSDLSSILHTSALENEVNIKSEKLLNENKATVDPKIASLYETTADDIQEVEEKLDAAKLQQTASESVKTNVDNKNSTELLKNEKQAINTQQVLEDTSDDTLESDEPETKAVDTKVDAKSQERTLVKDNASNKVQTQTDANTQVNKQNNNENIDTSKFVDDNVFSNTNQTTIRVVNPFNNTTTTIDESAFSKIEGKQNHFNMNLMPELRAINSQNQASTDENAVDNQQAEFDIFKSNDEVDLDYAREKRPSIFSGSKSFEDKVEPSADNEVNPSEVKQVQADKPQTQTQTQKAVTQATQDTTPNSSQVQREFSTRLLMGTIPSKELEDSVIPSDVVINEEDKKISLNASDNDVANEDTPLKINAIPDKTAGAAAITQGNSEPIPTQTVVDPVDEVKEKSSLLSKISSLFSSKKAHKVDVKSDSAINPENMSLNLLSNYPKGSPLDYFTNALRTQLSNPSLPQFLKDEAKNLLDKLSDPVNDLPSVSNWLNFTQGPLSPSSSQAIAMHQWAFMLLAIRFSQLGKSVDSFLKKAVDLNDDSDSFDEELSKYSDKLSKEESKHTVSSLIDKTFDQITRMQNPNRENLPVLFQYVPLPPNYEGGREGGFNAYPVVEEDGKKAWHLNFVFDLKEYGPVEIKAIAKLPEIKIAVVAENMQGLERVQSELPKLQKTLQDVGITTRSVSTRLGTIHMNSQQSSDDTQEKAHKDNETFSVDA